MDQRAVVELSGGIGSGEGDSMAKQLIVARTHLQEVPGGLARLNCSPHIARAGLVFADLG